MSLRAVVLAAYVVAAAPLALPASAHDSRTREQEPEEGTVDVDAAPETLDLAVPAFLLQPLVEMKPLQNPYFVSNRSSQTALTLS